MKKLLIATGLFSLYALSQRGNNHPKVFYPKSIPFGFNGFVIPPIGVFIRADQKGNQELLLHELIHWEQFQREGLIRFLSNYAAENQKNGYDGNKYEIEARYRETEFCKNNYTQCVREGLAKTVHNPNFRKGRN